MPLQPGYNLVTERVEETEVEMPALQFFRALAADDSITTPVTVTRLEDLLYHTSETDRERAASTLRRVLRQSRSVSSMDAVQFLFDGRLFDEDQFRVQIERSNEHVYLPVGEMFVERPQMMTRTQATTRK